MTHEDFSRQEEVKPSSDRGFGLVIAAFFLSAHRLVAARPRTTLDGAAGSAQQAVDEARCASLSRRQPLVLGLLFYATVTPIALLMRVLRKDPLRLRRDPTPQAIGSCARLPGRRPNP